MKTIKTSIGYLILLLAIIVSISCNDDEIAIPDPPFIDLEATSIEFNVENVTPNFTADAIITATITNIGEAFSTNENQIIIELLERPLGAAVGTVVDFARPIAIAPNGQLTLSFTRPWNASSPAEGEFPPEYILDIAYDPDFGIDANLNNDDFNFDNNRIIVSGAEINELIAEALD